MTILKAKNKNIYIQRVFQGCEHMQQQQQQQEEGEAGDIFDNELLGIFYGISNISLFMGAGMGNHQSHSGKFMEYNEAERYITMRMGTKYNLTIKNEDPVYLDTRSKLSILPK